MNQLKNETEMGKQRIIQEKVCFFQELAEEIKKNNVLTETALKNAISSIKMCAVKEIKEIKAVGKNESQSLQRHGSILKRKVSLESKKAIANLAKMRKTAVPKKERVSESENYAELKSGKKQNC